MRDATTYELNQGWEANGQPLVSSLIGTCIGEQQWDKEFLRMRVNSLNGTRPTRVRFYLTPEDAIADIALCEVSGGQLKSRRGYEFNIPRKLAERHRLQGRIVFYRITNELEEDFKIVDIQTQHKRLK
jgi:hypothetical protein